MQNGLRKKPTYDELINYLEVKQPKIRYPDRNATFLRNSHFLSQFDGNLFDLDEQQKEIAKQQLKETEIRNVVSNTTTASLLRGEAAQEQNRRTTAKATRPRGRPRKREAQTEDTLMYGPETLLFDIAADDKDDEAMEEADAVIEIEREKQDKKKEKIKQIVSSHLGEEIKDLPYIQQSTASSSTSNPNPYKPPAGTPIQEAEDTSRPRGRPPKSDKPDDNTENTQQPRGRPRTPKERTPRERTPRRRGKPKEEALKKVAMEEDTSKKRSSSKEPIEAPPKAKSKAEAPEEKAAKRLALKTEEAKTKAEQKAAITEAKRNRKEANLAAEAADEAGTSSTRTHGIGLIENKNPNYWKKQNITVIKEQAELRGHRFTDLETKGGGVKSKFKKFKKDDYLDILFKILKI